MKKYQVTILSNEEFKKITGELPKFSDEGFLVNQENWLDSMETHLKVPVVSIRPSGRSECEEVLVLTADGRIGEKKSIYGDLKTCKTVMTSIICEVENSEWSVFKKYEFPNLTPEECEKLKNLLEAVIGKQQEV